MTYQTQLLLSKVIISLAALLVVALVALGERLDQVLVFWLISLPILFYLLWGKLHGTGRSVRIVGYLGLAYCISCFTASGHEPFSFVIGLSILFLIGTIASIKRANLVKENSKVS